MDDFLDPALLRVQASLWGVWLLGVSLGLTACTATCLPFMGSWVLGRGGTQIQLLRDTALFVAGRILAYALLGAIAAGAGTWLAHVLHGGVGNLIIGSASIAAGVWLLRSGVAHAPCNAARNAGTTPPLLLGFSLSLTPCAPLASLLAVCAAAGSIGWGVANGVAFGLGAALTPLLILLPLVSLLGKNLRENRAWITRWIRWGAATVLVLLGFRRILLAL
ncbi:urease accessory protein UreH domain-containing protein [Sideroxydans lithotrophicus]|uniref:Cytochrome c biogenesis protein, transmembrane region n=1 Tax=Sideroxydans lithotrophicus (strain ES-1) TaxID=580332 RepID=D5CRN8_SIDLE|nr:sulfite exporter TauE/SafE family protein [Sideroxydans lithotrophicus]ADE11624.1 cytochrome c biogenesis protein, transmembrane region [Sideroxydans lithotrophicus ES-1]